MNDPLHPSEPCLVVIVLRFFFHRYYSFFLRTKKMLLKHIFDTVDAYYLCAMRFILLKTFRSFDNEGESQVSSQIWYLDKFW